MQNTDFPSRINKWEMFEVQIDGPMEGNPFVEQKVTAVFSCRSKSVVVEGFYDGDGVYKVRFMPSFEGKHTFAIRSSFMDGSISGAFYVDPPKDTNKGPVRRSGTYHFAYENGEPYNSVGTTCYVWNLQPEEQIEKTLENLKKARFNKIRFCVFPKHYVYNFKDPEEFPYEGTPMDASVLTEDNFLDYWGKDNGSTFDHTRFNPSYFAKIERCVAALADAGIEADIILFHPYDRWGFSCMSREENDLYLKYAVTRLSAYHNVWWAMANEWDLIPSKSVEDWEHYGNLVAELDPYQHLRSIHNCREMYDHSSSWITHASVQRVDLYKGAELTDELRTKYGKPVVMDEIAYEGNLPLGWGNITAEEMVRRFWETAVRGGYPGHGETYLNEDGVIWWSHGGELHGESWKRVGFLLDVMNEVPGSGLVCLPMEWDSVTAVPEEEQSSAVKSQYIFYYSFMRPSSRTFHIDDDTWYTADVIDTWDMTITEAGTFRGKFTVELPQKQYMAIRLRIAENYVEEEPGELDTAEEVTAEETDFLIPAEPVEEEPEITAEVPVPEDTEEEEPDFDAAEEPEEAVETAEEEPAEEESLDVFPELMDTLREVSDFQETAEIEVPEEAEEPEETEEPAEQPAEEEPEVSDDEETAEVPVVDDEEEFPEDEDDIANTIEMLKLTATQQNSFFETKERRQSSEDNDSGDTEDVTGNLRAALDSMRVTGETAYNFKEDDLEDTQVLIEDDDDEEEGGLTSKLQFVSGLRNKLFGKKND